MAENHTPTATCLMDHTEENVSEKELRRGEERRDHVSQVQDTLSFAEWEEVSDLFILVLEVLFIRV